MWIPKTELQLPDLGASLSLGSYCPIKRIPSVKQAVAVQCLIRSSLQIFCVCLCVCVSACLCPGLLLRRLFLYLYPCQIPSLNKAGFSRVYIVTLCIAQTSHFLPRKTQVVLSYVFVIALKLQCNLVKQAHYLSPTDRLADE